MNTTPTNQARPVNARQMTEEELEAQAIAWCNRISRKLDNKRSKTKGRGQYENSRR
jgi:hypothetical protein